MKESLGLPSNTSAKAIGMLRNHMQKPEKQYVCVYIYVHPSVSNKLGKGITVAFSSQNFALA